MTKRSRPPRRKTRATVPRVRGVAIGKVIAVRRLESTANPNRVVTVQVGAPRKTRGQDDYFCPYRIQGIGDEVARAAYGVDAVQALQLVMHAIGSALARRPDLRWYGDGNLGFPVPRAGPSMNANRSIEFHDSTVHVVRIAGANTVIEMTVYIHSSAGRPGVDAGTGWYQGAEMVVAGAVLGQDIPAVPLELDDGVVTVDDERFETVVPLPLDRTGRVDVVLHGMGGTFRVSGSGLRIILKGSPGKPEQFPGSAL